MPPRQACGVPAGPCSCCPVMVTFLWTPWLRAVGGQVPCCCTVPPVASGPFALWMMMEDNTKLKTKNICSIYHSSQASQTCANITHFGKMSSLWTKGGYTRQTENVPSLDLDPYHTRAVGNKDQPNKVMFSLSNKVTAQLC